MTARFDPRIQIHLDYEPMLDCYPEEVASKKEAMEYDIQAFREGAIGMADLTEFAEEVTVTLVEVKVPE
jgi:hypothetical protein